MDMSLGCLGGHEIVSCMVQWTLDGKDPEVLLVVGFCVARALSFVMTPCRIVFTIGKTSFAFGFPGGHSEDRPEENLAGHAEDTLTGGPARDPVERSETLYTNSNSYMTHFHRTSNDCFPIIIN